MFSLSRLCGISFSSLTQSSWFRLILAFKIATILLFIPIIQTKWFVPFVVSAIEHPSIDPWSHFYTAGGDVSAFPYGPVMLFVHLPTTFIGWCFDYVFQTSYFAGLGFRFSLLISDFGIFVLLLAMYEHYRREILVFYWASPFVFYISYWHGQTDIVPVLFFVATFFLLRRQKFAASGGSLALAVAAKHSMLVAAPFVAMYYWRRRANGTRFDIFSLCFFSITFLLEGPLLFSEGYRHMVLATHEAAKLLWLSIPMGEHQVLYPTLLVYIFLLHYVWRMRQLNADLLWASMGVAFGVIILMTPASPGWFLWLVPVLATHQARKGGSAVALSLGFACTFIIYNVLNSTGAVLSFGDYDSHLLMSVDNVPGPIVSGVYTLLVALGLMTTLQVMRDGIQMNDFYRLGRRPLAIGIVGDSSTGKTTFETALLDLFGRQMSITLSGDDYHNWGRTSPMWNSMTHLDPRANRLAHFANDVRRILDGEVIKVGEYDHAIGRFLPMAKRRSRNLVIVSGLHTFYPRALAEDMDVKFFLQMDEELRFVLKLRRDVEERGQDENKVRQSIERRRSDYERYVEPQAERANIVFTLQAINKDLLKHGVDDRNLKLHALIRNGVYVQDLVKVLVGICGLHVNTNRQDGAGAVEIEVSGDVAADDIRMACGILLPHMDELINKEQGFKESILGVMQLIALAEIDESLKRRRRV